MNNRTSKTTVALLALAIFSIASSAVLVRWSDAPPLAMAFWRTAAGAALLTPASRRAHDFGSPPSSRSTLRLTLLAGAALGLHFAAWLPSLTMTSVAASVTLVSTAPIFVAVWLWFGDSKTNPSTRTWIAIGIAVIGTVVIAGTDLLTSPGSITGDALALLGSLGAAIYLVAGGQLRRSLTTAQYAAPAYGVAAVVLLVVCLLSGTAITGFSLKGWITIAAMVVGPQLCGHTVLNHLLGKLGTVTVSLALLTEPVFASVFVWALFADQPSTGAWIGAPLVLGGLALQIRERPRSEGA